MVTVEEAKQLLSENTPTFGLEEVPIADALNYVLAEDVFSPIDLPSFDQSSMDGYAVCSENNFDRKEFTVVGEIKAGDDLSVQLSEGEAVRIFTGAAVPPSADSIVIQENVNAVDGKIILTKSYKRADHIRFKNSQIKQGEQALKKGSVLNPGAIGFLASLGLNKVKVYARPSVSIVVTGNEIISPGEVLVHGKVYESNSFSIVAAMQQMNITVCEIYRVRDEKEKLHQILSDAISNSDIVILSGGISVGKYDLVYDALQEFGIKVLFYKVSQKPGKPVLAGKIGDKLIFALPGNPASALVCFYEYVYPSIRKMTGFGNFELKKIRLKSDREIMKKEGRALFIRSKITDTGVLELEGQGSDMLRSFAMADAFIYLREEQGMVKQNEEVEVHLLPFQL